jgi:hypothetical protein
MALTQVQGGMLQGSSNTTTTIQSNGTTAITIDSSQNVGIGTTTMTRNLNIGNSTNAVGIGFQNTGTSGKNWSIFATNAGSSIGGGNLGFYNDTDTAYRMILDGTGNLQFNSGYGSVATAYGCRAWVNFNGTDTPAIRSSGNVSSISDNGTGLYTVNFSNSMPDTNYSAVASTRRNTTSGGTGENNVNNGVNFRGGSTYSTAFTTSAVQICTGTVTNEALNDFDYVAVQVFR